MDDFDAFQYLLHLASPDDEDDLSELSTSADNMANIANGSFTSTSPEEEIIRLRGSRRPRTSSNSNCDTNQGKRSIRKERTREQLVMALATRKSPRKAVGPQVDYASYFFRSPTPKKAPQKSGTTPKKEPSPAALKARINFRKRLSLSSFESSSTGTASPANSVNGDPIRTANSVNSDSCGPKKPRKSCLKTTATTINGLPSVDH